MRKQSYRMPSGEFTENSDEWAQSWSAFANRVAKFFPGYRVMGMDPGVSLVNDAGYGDHFTISLSGCKALLNE